jgi:hypothetical protein
MFAHVKVTNNITQVALTGQRDEALTPDHQSLTPKIQHRTNKHTGKSPHVEHAVQSTYRQLPVAETHGCLMCSGKGRVFAGYPPHNSISIRAAISSLTPRT